MGTAIHQGLDLLEARKATYKANAIDYYRPWLFLITDGQPQGESEDILPRAIQRIRDSEASRKVAFFAVAVGDADVPRLASLLSTTPQKLQGLRFVELFRWLSASMSKVSQSRPGEQTILPPINNWGGV